MRVLLLGATGTAGRGAARALLAAGHEVRALVRPGSTAPEGTEPMEGDVRDPDALARAMAGREALVSCLASRTGAPDEARAIDRDAHIAAFSAAKEAGVELAVLVSAICVQRPRLAFQHAKLEAEAALAASGIPHAIVRPTAFFKSLSGQVRRVARGKPFLVFGNGRLTACKPISDGDLGRYVALCLTPNGPRGILPVGGPGPAIAPLDQAAMLEELTGRPVRIRRVPAAAPRLIAGALGLLPGRGGAAEMARIAHYYATESMLMLRDGAYDTDATPEFGTETLRDHYAALLAGDADDDRGAHALLD